jgi:hypothetical protein
VPGITTHFPYKEREGVDGTVREEMAQIADRECWLGSPFDRGSRKPRGLNGEKLIAWPYRERNLVERLVNRLKGYFRIATRYEKRAIHDLGMLTIASIVFWL